MAKLPTALDKIPPQSLEAEQSTLGSMLISRAAIEKAMELLQPEDFYRDSHRYIFEAISDLARRDEPADLLTVAEELQRQGRLDLVGGRPALFQLVDSVPTAAHCEFYAKIVSEKAVLRRLIDASGQIIAWAHEGEEEIDEIVDRSERLIFGVAQRHLSQYFVPLRPLLFEAMERLEEARETHERVTGVPTGFDVLDDMTSGLQPSDLIIVAGRPSMGKCLTAWTLIDLPDGERLTIEECVRRRVPRVFGLSPAGEVRPTAVSDWIDSGVKPCYRVRTRLGREVEVTGHHPFLTVRGWVPLHDLAVGSRIAVPRTVPAFGTEQPAPAMVRLLAYFIAEGGLTGTVPHFTNTDPEIIADFKAIIGEHFPECQVGQERISYKVVRPDWRYRQTEPNPVTAWLKEQGLWGKLAEQKRFPASVWRWSRSALAEFLRVLFSCDGTVYDMVGYPRIEFSVASEGLAQDVHHALTRLGIVAKLWRKRERCWRVEITEPESVAQYYREIGWIGEKTRRCSCPLSPRRSNNGHAPREAWALVRAAAAQRGLSLVEIGRLGGEKAALADGYNPHIRRSIPQRRLAAYARVLDVPALTMVSGPDIYWDEIVSIEPMGEHQVYDLTVPDGANFIAQDVCVHNTSLALAFAVNAAVRRQVPVAIFSLEMSKEQLVQRMLCSEAKVNSARLRSGYLTEAGDGREGDWRKLTRAIGRLGDLPIYVDDASDISAMEMRAKCRRLRAEQGLGLVIIDYLQLIRGHGRIENRNQEISIIARSLKGLARELQVPVIALSQLSRAVERRDDKRPLLSDLRESGSIEQDADIVMMLYRSTYYKRGEESDDEQPRPVVPGQEDLEESELIIAKHRNGPTGTVKLGFLRSYARFENLSDYE